MSLSSLLINAKRGKRKPSYQSHDRRLQRIELLQLTPVLQSLGVALPVKPPTLPRVRRPRWFVKDELLHPLRFRRPHHRPTPEEPAHHVVQRPRNADPVPVIEAVARSGFTVFYCVNTNAQARAAEQRLKEETKLRVFRSISKGQRLVERLERHGVGAFNVEYAPQSSPYAAAVIDRSATLDRLNAALTARGLSHIDGHDSRSLLKLYLDGPALPVDAKQFDVCIITTMAFLARTLSKRRPWWVDMNMAKGERWVNIAEHKDGGKWVPNLGHRAIAIFDEPREEEFDEVRWVNPDHVETLQKNEGVHDLLQDDREWFERRPADLMFGLGLRRGCGRDTGKKSVMREDDDEGADTYLEAKYPGPHALVLTSSPSVAQGATRCLKLRADTRYWRLSPRHSVLREL